MKHDQQVSTYTRHDVIRLCLTNRPLGLIMEFGVWQGDSINFIAGLVPNETVYGFDSFEGLPEDFDATYRKGHFKLDNPPVCRDNVTLVVGYFKDTLPFFLEEHSGNVGFVHVDCDLYSSTKTVLFGLVSRLQNGTVLLFDEFYSGVTGAPLPEAEALQEFCRVFDVTYDFLAERLDTARCSVAVQLKMGEGEHRR